MLHPLDNQVLSCPADTFLVRIRHFSDINHRIGFEGGNHVLDKQRQRLERLFQGRGRVIRLSGTEFLCLCYGNRTRDANWQIAHQIIDSLEHPIFCPLGRQMVSPSLLVGVLAGNPRGTRLYEAVKKASMAIHVAKNKPGSQIAFYDDSIRIQINELIDTENLVRDALYKDILHYLIQPKVNRRGQIVGGELLMRLHDNGRPISPATFIPVAERTGHIVALGASLLLSACEQLRHLPPQVDLAVNVSSIQLRQKNFIATLENMLCHAGVPPNRLEIEVTESVMADDAHVVSTLEQIKKMGVSIAIDDFGTGYSGLSYLDCLPADILKIDQAFVRKIGSATGDKLLTHIIQMGKTLGMKLVAEGVENSQQAEFLTQAGCDQMQGFYFYPPLEPTDFSAKAISFTPAKPRSVAKLRIAD